jgi:hypothetical protein
MRSSLPWYGVLGVELKHQGSPQFALVDEIGHRHNLQRPECCHGFDEPIPTFRITTQSQGSKKIA